MKQFYLFFSLLLLTMACGSNEEMLYVWAESAEVKNSSDGHEVIATLQKGERVKFIGVKSTTQTVATIEGKEYKDYYLKVKLKNSTLGWVHAGYLQFNHINTTEEASKSDKLPTSSPNSNKPAKGSDIKNSDAAIDYSFISGQYEYNSNSRSGSAFVKFEGDNLFRFSLNIANSRGCVGDISSKGRIIEPNKGQVIQNDCILDISFNQNSIEITEKNCMNAHGMNCSFSGNYPKIDPIAKKAAIKKQSDDEKLNPKKYLFVNTNNQSGVNLLLQNIVKGSVTNTATYESYNNINFRVSYYDKRSILLGEKIFNMNRVIMPAQSADFKFQVSMPLNAKTYQVEISSASIANQKVKCGACGFENTIGIYKCQSCGSAVMED